MPKYNIYEEYNKLKQDYEDLKRKYQNDHYFHLVEVKLLKKAIVDMALRQAREEDK